MTTRKATAIWEGGLRSGKGNFKADSGVISGPYSFSSRFDNGIGTSPEELLAAAEACCFCMAVCNNLEKAGTPASRIEVNATCIGDMVSDHLRITTLKLFVRGTVTNCDAATFQRLCLECKDNCTISMALKNNIRVELETKLL
jgi:osmotically inducible protein OsmC